MSKIYGIPVATPLRPGNGGGTGGENGKSAYELAVAEGFEGSLTQWLESLVGPQGVQGPAGADAPADTYLPKDGSEAMTGPLAMGGNRITGLGAPVNDNDAVRKRDAAPAGYGLGNGATLKNWTDVDSITVNGWYKFNEVIQIGDTTLYSPFMRVDSADTGNAAQTIFPYVDRFVMLHRRLAAGAWGEWLWDSPYFWGNAEYATTEMWEGKIVYTKVIHLGRLNAANAAVRVSHNCNSVNFISCRGLAIDTSTGTTWELVNGGNNGDCYVDNGTVIIHSVVDMTAFHGYAVLKYTK